MKSSTITENAQKLHDMVTEATQGLRRFEWMRLMALAKMHDLELWSQVGAESWLDYIAMPEVDLTIESARRRLRIAAAFGPLIEDDLLNKEDLERIGIARADMIASFLLDPSGRPNPDALEWVSKAQSLSFSDFNTEVKRGRCDLSETVQNDVEAVRDELVAMANKLVGSDDPIAILDAMLLAIGKAKQRLASELAPPE